MNVQDSFSLPSVIKYYTWYFREQKDKYKEMNGSKSLTGWR